MENFYYRVGNVETRNPWFLPRFSTVKELFQTLKGDTELEDFRILLHGELLYSWNSWDVKLFLEYDNWETNLDLYFLERIMSKIYRYGFDKNLLLDITFCGKHQTNDYYSDAKSRGFLIPSFNFTSFIKFNQSVKSIDGNTEEVLVSNYFQTEKVTLNLVKYYNNYLKYNNYSMNRYKNEQMIFKEGLPIEIFNSYNSFQFEKVKKTEFNRNATKVLGFSPWLFQPVNVPQWQAVTTTFTLVDEENFSTGRGGRVF